MTIPHTRHLPLSQPNHPVTPNHTYHPSPLSTSFSGSLNYSSSHGQNLANCHHDQTSHLSPEIDPIFAQFAYTDASVRKTRHNAYQKLSGVPFEGLQSEEQEPKRRGTINMPKSTTTSHIHTSPQKISDISHETWDHTERQPRKRQSRTPQGPLHLRAKEARSRISLSQEDSRNAIPSKRTPGRETQNFQGYVISGIAPPHRTWKPIPAKTSMIHHLISLVLTRSGLEKGTPMLIRRTKYDKKSTTKKAHSDLLDKLLEPESCFEQGQPSAYELLSATEAIAFTNVAFYRIVFPSHSLNFTNSLNSPNRTHPTVSFLATEWADVRTMLLHEEDKENSPEDLEHPATKIPFHDLDPPVGILAQGKFVDVVRRFFPWAANYVESMDEDVNTKPRLRNLRERKVSRTAYRYSTDTPPRPSGLRKGTVGKNMEVAVEGSVRRYTLSAPIGKTMSKRRKLGSEAPFQ